MSEIKQPKIKHIRINEIYDAFSENEERRIYPKGGATIMYNTEGDKFVASVAFCSLKDRFNKKEGIKIAKERFENKVFFDTSDTHIFDKDFKRFEEYIVYHVIIHMYQTEKAYTLTDEDELEIFTLRRKCFNGGK